MKWYLQAFVSAVNESVLFTLVCAAIALGGVFVLQVPFLDGLGFVLLVVGAGLMLVGGALGFVSPGNVKLVNLLMRSKMNPGPEDYRRTKQRAALYSMTGLLLFGYSLGLAAIAV